MLWIRKKRETIIAKHNLEEIIELGELVVGNPDMVVSQNNLIPDGWNPGTLGVCCSECDHGKFIKPVYAFLKWRKGFMGSLFISGVQGRRAIV